jgi:hypothetical protein
MTRTPAGAFLCRIARFFLCSAFVGLAVKIMDDWIDRSNGRGGDEPPHGERACDFASRLGTAALPYALVCLACGVAFDPPTALALFFGSYAVGMALGTADRYPSGLSGAQESLAVLAASVMACGLRLTLTAGLCILCVQALDDVIDYHVSGLATAPLVRRFGLWETALAAAGFLLVAAGLDAPRTLGVMLAAALVWKVERLLESRQSRMWYN